VKNPQILFAAFSVTFAIATPEAEPILFPPLISVLAISSKYLHGAVFAGLTENYAGSQLSIVCPILHHGYSSRYFPVPRIIGEDEAGLPIKRRTKEHMTLLINRQLNARKIKIPISDKEVEDQLCTHTYTLGQKGIIYKKGHDHIVDAIRCMMLARSMELDPQPVKQIEMPDLTFLPTGPNFNRRYG